MMERMLDLLALSHRAGFRVKRWKFDTHDAAILASYIGITTGQDKEKVLDNMLSGEAHMFGVPVVVHEEVWT